MTHSFILNVNQLHMTTTGCNPTLPLRMSASPFKQNGMPYGLVASNGLVHNAMPEGLPALIAYKDGGVEIRSDFNAKDVSIARFVVSGSAHLISNKRMIEIPEILNTQKTKTIARMGVGTLGKGQLIFITSKCTLRELQVALYSHGSHDAMMLAYGDIYLEYPRGGIKMGTTMPVTAFEARDFKELARPIVVINAGHGGADMGAVGLGLREKDLNLKCAKTLYQNFIENYDGTFLMTRIDDSSMSNKEVTTMSNAVGADFFISLHCNASDNKGTGYESFIHTGASEVAVEIQKVVHKEVVDFLTPYGFRDRGMKRANFQVLRETDCPALLVENLFIDYPKDNAFLGDRDLFKALCLATANGYAKAIGLLPKVLGGTVEEDKELYKVQVGAFKFRKGAEALLEKIQIAGFDGYIKKE